MSQRIDGKFHIFICLISLSVCVLILILIVCIYVKYCGVLMCFVGCVQEASKIFNGMKINDIISWTTMINGYAEHGYSQEAINLFEKISVLV